MQRFGPYLIQQPLAQGGMGAVYVALHEPTGRQVALKVILGEASPEDRARLVREAQATAALRHPNIVTVHDAGEIGGRAYLAMELLDGQSLKGQIAKAGPLPSREAAEMLRDLADAMAAAHDAGVLHRDLKPDNVIVTQGGTAKLVDFGLARRSTDEAMTRTGEMLGTPAYMSPEQASGERGSIDARSDVYGLGAILYTMLCGEPPFSGATAINIIAKVLRGLPEPPSKRRPGVDKALEVICMTCLATEPEDRFPGARDLSHALTGYMSGASRKASPVLLGVALALLVSLGAGGGWLFSRVSPPDSGSVDTASAGPVASESGPANPAASGGLASEPPKIGVAAIDSASFGDLQSLEVVNGWLLAVEERGLRLRNCEKVQRGPALRAPLQLGAEPLRVEVDLSADYVQGDCAVVLRLQPRDGSGPLELRLDSRGGQHDPRKHYVELVSPRGRRATFGRMYTEPVIEFRLRMTYDPTSRAVACVVGTPSVEKTLSFTLSDPLRAGEFVLSLGIEGVGPERGRRTHFSSVWLRRLVASAPGLVCVTDDSPQARLGHAQRQLAAGRVRGRDALVQLTENPELRRTARLALALALANEHEQDGSDALAALMRDAEGVPVRRLALHNVFALNRAQRRAIALAYVSVEGFDLNALNALGRSLVRVKKSTTDDKWGIAQLCFLAARRPDDTPVHPLDVGRANLMSGCFEEAIEILIPLEEGLGGTGSTWGRAGYTFFRLRRYEDAIRWWTNGRLENAGGMKGWYSGRLRIIQKLMGAR